jgi:hypothetical protein
MKFGLRCSIFAFSLILLTVVFSFRSRKKPAIPIDKSETPELIIRTPLSSFLFLNCGNKVFIDCPELGESYNPSFKTSGARVVKGKQKTEIIIYPNSAFVKVTVVSEGKVLGEVKFTVITLPYPDIQLTTIEGEEPDLKRGVSAEELSGLVLNMEPHPSIRQLLPEDVSYQVTDWEVVLVRQSRPVHRNTFASSEGNLSEMMKKAEKGDRLMVEIKGVEHQNSLGQKNKAPIPLTIINIPVRK